VEQITFIFEVEEEAKQETAQSRQQAPCFMLFLA
jgi:hypothetical protein